MTAVLLSLLLLALPGAGEPDLGRLRALWLEAVREPAAVERGLAEISTLRAHAPAGRTEALLAAYEGALTTLRAKHGGWPAQRMRDLRGGLRRLDAVVAANPELAEARYVRLMSCYYLPGLFGRKGSVREDFRALARLLPGVRGEYPPELYAAIVRFVLERGGLAPGERRPLEGALAEGR